MLKVKPPPSGPSIPQGSLLSWALDPEVRAGRDWDCTTGNLEALGRNCQRTMSRSPTGQCADLGVETECTSTGETITLLFILSKNMYRVSNMCQTACQVPGKHKGHSDGSKVYRNLPLTG